MAWKLYDYVDSERVNVIKEWTESKTIRSSGQLAKLNAKFDMLGLHGPNLPVGLLSDSSITTIKKLRVRGQLNLRPHLCEGPIHIDQEYTLLVGAIEKGFKTDPLNAAQIAETRRREIIRDPSRRRPHERVGKATKK